jgi:hypothetical protein
MLGRDSSNPNGLGLSFQRDTSNPFENFQNDNSPLDLHLPEYNPVMSPVGFPTHMTPKSNNFSLQQQLYSVNSEPLNNNPVDANQQLLHATFPPKQHFLPPIPRLYSQTEASMNMNQVINSSPSVQDI